MTEDDQLSLKVLLRRLAEADSTEQVIAIEERILRLFDEQDRALTQAHAWSAAWKRSAKVYWKSLKNVESEFWFMAEHGKCRPVAGKIDQAEAPDRILTDDEMRAFYSEQQSAWDRFKLEVYRALGIDRLAAWLARVLGGE